MANKDIIDEVFMKQVGLHVLFVIKRRTLDGKFLPGSSPGAGEYSTKPFAMPSGAISKQLEGKIKKAGKDSPGDFQMFTSKAGTSWVVVKKGYKRIRELGGRPSDKVTMIWSGRYMKDLSVLSRERSAVEIGWKSDENKKLAEFHESMGAGKSRRLHKILGLTKEEIAEVERIFGEKIALKMQSAVDLELGNVK